MLNSTTDEADISIHALREEGDLRSRPLGTVAQDFYPRPPRGGRPDCQRNKTRRHQFLSTPSARRATLRHGRPYFGRHISIHALREEGDRGRSLQSRRLPPISIHALREEGDFPPLLKLSRQDISIHALREEGDPRWRPIRPTTAYFYPRPPRGGRHGISLLGHHGGQFLSTPSARRATYLYFLIFRHGRFLSTPSARRATAKR